MLNSKIRITKLHFFFMEDGRAVIFESVRSPTVPFPVLF